MDCNCNDDIHDDISQAECPFDLKQIQKLAFQTRGKVIWDSADGTGTGLLGVPQADSQTDTLADWQARRVAVDNTKIVVTPFVGGDPQIVAGEPITEGGGDNTTLNGVEEVLGTNPSAFSATFKSLSPEQEAALKKISCITSEVYFFTESGKIVARKLDNGTITGFRLQTYFFSDRNNAGFGTKDTHTMSFALPKGWSEELVLIEPVDFNPLFDLV